MPHLQFEINKKVSNDIKKSFCEKIRESFAKIMDTQTGHIAISIREYEPFNLSIGRVDIGDEVCLMNLDIREGRTIEKRRELALVYMSIVKDEFKIPNNNQYITFTQHDGEDFHLIEKYLSSWASGEDPLA
ncbi:tautomerase [Arcobacter sp. KX21116]|uniref:tautomerase n=1 Tax=Arcobacter iocasae TaxID=2906515 RepID=UPI0035D46295|tara:strand:+ start:25842 stop:26234 length:393 start_codon:yes stop_codon:yes gene_type:complete